MKEQILSEIQRIANATGKTPGKMAFSRETGIKSHHWEGVIWARWSDAVTEAGLEPNALQGRLATEDVLRQVAQATRHFGHFPSSAEIRLYGKYEPSFASHNTINSHFATRNQLRQALKNFAADHAEYRDISSLIPASMQATDSRANLAEGLVYLLKSGDYFKIGRSNQIERRVRTITIALPESLELIHTIRTDDPAGIEAYWHRRFKSLRANGEWFKLGSREVAAFRRRNYQ